MQSAQLLQIRDCFNDVPDVTRQTPKTDLKRLDHIVLPGPGQATLEAFLDECVCCAHERFVMFRWNDCRNDLIDLVSSQCRVLNSCASTVALFVGKEFCDEGTDRFEVECASALRLQRTEDCSGKTTVRQFLQMEAGKIRDNKRRSRSESCRPVAELSGNIDEIGQLAAPCPFRGPLVENDRNNKRERADRARSFPAVFAPEQDRVFGDSQEHQRIRLTLMLDKHIETHLCFSRADAVNHILAPFSQRLIDAHDASNLERFPIHECEKLGR